MEQISFSILELFMAKKEKGEQFIFPTFDTFKTFGKQFYTTVEGTFYEVNVEYDTDYIWFSFDFNKTNPRADQLTNINTGEKRNNERTEEEAELVHQVFFLYYYKTNLLYSSNAKKKNLLPTVLKERLQIDFHIKSIFKTMDEFISVLKQCKSISFTNANNIFGSNSKKRQSLIDLTGTDSPTNFKIEAGYSKQHIENFLRELGTEKTNATIDGLIICGKDETNFDIAYNTDSFIKKIGLSSQKDDNGKYISNEVKKNLILKINNNEGS